MRRTGSKGRKTDHDESQDQSPSTSNNSASLQIELELLAVKAKNAELIKAHTKLLHENCEMRNEIISLRQDLLELESRSNIVKSHFDKVAQDLKRCTPSLLEMVNLFMSVTEYCKSRNSVLDVSSGLYRRESTPKSKAITHSVKPHTVNGTVLNLTPTITLTRLSSGNEQRLNQEPSSTTMDSRNFLPSTSNNLDVSVANFETEHLSSQLDSSDDTNEEFVSRRSQLKSKNADSLAPSIDDTMQMEVENEEQFEESLEQSSESTRDRRLSTIREESICSNSGATRTSLGEIRIYLSRLSPEDMQVRRSHEDSRTSTEVNVNDTCLNIETTVIENKESGVPKGLRADIMVFSPHTNSTRLDGDSPLFDDFIARGGRRTSRTPDLSEIQSSEVTPSSGIVNSVKGGLSPTPFSWIPTPSLSAMGDIDKSNYSRLDILAESERERKASPMPAVASPLRKTRSKTRRREKESSEQESPRSSRESQATKRSALSFVSVKRGGSGDKVEQIQTPTIVLERIENISAEHRLLATSPGCSDSDNSIENENITNNKKSRSKGRKISSRSKSPKRNVKRKKTDEANSLHDRLKEVQIRLSNYAPETASDALESPMKCSRRPSRAARPTTLKEPSLMKKLRRMF